MVSQQEVAAHYQQNFYTVNACTRELKQIAYQLRYRIFVEECGYQLGNFDHQKKIETDDDDDIAYHSLLFHRPSSQPIGYIRLIPFIEDSGRLLPIEIYGKNSFADNEFTIPCLRTSKTGEVSRMCILSSFRRKQFNQSDKKKIFSGNAGAELQLQLNYIPIYIVLAGLNLMNELKLDYSVAMMQPNLATILRHYGIQHRRIGHAIDYHGLRTPHMIDTQKSIRNLNPRFLKLNKIIRAELFSTQYAV